MPHVIVKLWPGKSEQQKRRLAQAITKDVMDVLNYGDESVSVAFEEVDAAEWAAKVYQPDTSGRPDDDVISRDENQTQIADSIARASTNASSTTPRRAADAVGGRNVVRSEQGRGKLDGDRHEAGRLDP